MAAETRPYNKNWIRSLVDGKPHKGSRTRLAAIEMEMYGRRYPEEVAFYLTLDRGVPLPPGAETRRGG
jgi:hypothetical protein